MRLTSASPVYQMVVEDTLFWSSAFSEEKKSTETTQSEQEVPKVCRCTDVLVVTFARPLSRESLVWRVTRLSNEAS